MSPFDNLSQFSELVLSLPEIHFSASGISHPRISLFASTQMGDEPASTRNSVAALPANEEFTAAVARADADLRLYELAIDYPVTELDPATATHTIAFGMTTIEPGPDMFALAALVNTPRQANNLRAAVDVQPEGALDMLASEGGRDICALFGAIIAARMAELPVILDGANAVAAAAVLRVLNQKAISHCAIPAGSPLESSARHMEMTILPCHDSRPLFSLPSAILPCRSLVIS